MAGTAFAGMVVPELFNQYVTERTATVSRFRQSGIVTNMSEIVGDQMGGTTVNMPFFQDLSGDDEVVDDTTNLTINAITTSQDISAKLYRAKVFGSTDLAADLGGSDPIQAIVNLFGEYWNRMEQKTLIKILTGAMGCATMSGNVSDISGGSTTAANFDPEAFIDAVSLLGDRQDDLAGVAVHGDTYSLMKKLDLIDFVKPSEGDKLIPTYMGHYLLVDDGLPKTGSGADTIYTTYLFGNGAIGFAERPPKVPVETGRDPLTHGGQDYVVHRRQVVLHPRGIKWKGVPSGATPTDAELATTTNWERVWENKNVKIVSFIHKLYHA
jgi:hypothetical protein